MIRKWKRELKHEERNIEKSIRGENIKIMIFVFVFDVEISVAEIQIQEKKTEVEIKKLAAKKVFD